jgi:hypothetical protein
VLDVAEVLRLGLREGQIVRPTLEVRNERLMLLLDGRLVEWPGGAATRFAAGSSPVPLGWLVRLLANGSAQLVPMRGREASSPLFPPLPPSPLSQASVTPPSTHAEGTRNPSAVTTATVVAPEPGKAPARWAHLMARPGPWMAWMAALRAVPLSLSPSASALAARASSTVATPSTVVPLLPTTSLGLLDGVSLREAVRRSGLFAEARLARGERVDLSDVKLALFARLRSAEAASGSTAAALVSALEDIEAAQVQALVAGAEGGAVVHLALGFRDASPVTLRLARDPPEEGRSAESEISWTVDIHSRSEAWGPLWLQTRVAGDGRVGIVMWAEREDVCAAARADAERLSLLLQGEGLQLDRIQVVHGARRDLAAEPTGAQAGSLLDLRA